MKPARGKCRLKRRMPPPSAPCPGATRRQDLLCKPTCLTPAGLNTEFLISFPPAGDRVDLGSGQGFPDVESKIDDPQERCKCVDGSGAVTGHGASCDGKHPQCHVVLTSPWLAKPIHGDTQSGSCCTCGVDCVGFALVSAEPMARDGSFCYAEALLRCLFSELGAVRSCSLH